MRRLQAAFRRSRQREFGFNPWGVVAFAVIVAVVLVAALGARGPAAHGQRVRHSELTFKSCKDASGAGYGPIFNGQAAYSRHLDSDGDGVACEPFPR